MINVNIGGDKESKGFVETLKSSIDALGHISIGVIVRFILVAVTAILLLLAVNIILNRNAFETVVERVVKASRDEKEDMDIRDRVSPKVQRHLLNMVYKLDCDRAFIIELHNGTRNATNLPFKYFDMTYEEVNDNRHIKHVSQDFMNVMVTHYKLPYYVADKKFFYGDSKALHKVDSRFADNFDAEYNGKYLAMHIIRTSKDDIGFLGVEFEHEDSMKVSKEMVRTVIETNSILFSDLLDLDIQKKKKE